MDPFPSQIELSSLDEQHDGFDFDPTLTSPGPKQTRKPTDQSADSGISQPTTYDPRALLNPKASIIRNSMGSVNDSIEGQKTNEGFGATSMLERLHNITGRDDVQNKRRKITNDGNDELDEQSHRSNAPAGHIGRGGIISDHLKEERKQIASKSENPVTESASNTIDLTGEDDDDEVQVLEDRGDEEVCLGVLRSVVNAYTVPVGQKIGKEWWAPIKVNIRRPDGKHTLIEALDKTGKSFGRLEPKLASGLTPILDGGRVNKVRISIRLDQRRRDAGEEVGQRISKGLRAIVFVYCPRRLSNSVGRFLSQKQLFLTNAPVAPGIAVENPHSPQVFGAKGPNAQVTYVTRTAEQIRQETSSMFDSLAKAEDLPEMEANESIINTPLMTHQKKALNFMMLHERNDYDAVEDGPAHSLWKFDMKRDGRATWTHVITSEVVKEKPDPTQGGILADVMGLGKTLSILALIAHTNDASKIFRNTSSNRHLQGGLPNAQGTLIICPKSVLANWQEQIEAHVKPQKLKIYTYHGTSRTQDLHQLCKFDIVLTSYNTAATEIGDGTHSKRALASVNWFRIVLDEAHSIRTVSTKISKACCALNAERRWAVTGTPLQNRLDDIGSLIKFLRVKPFDNQLTWAQHIMSPLKSGKESAVDHLRILMNSVTLRRVKETVGLADRVEERVRLEFSKSEQALYDEFAKRSATKFHTMTQGTNVLRGKAYAHVLKSLGRLRVICAHGREMLSEEDMKDIEGSDSSNAIILDIGDEPGMEKDDEFISERQAYETFAMMQDTEVDRCINCDDKLKSEDRNRGPNPNIDLDEETPSDDEEEEENGVDETVFGYLTQCWHLLCRECKEKHEAEIAGDLTADHYYTCPHCNQYMRSGLFPLHVSGLKKYKEDLAAVSKTSKTARWDESTYTGPHTKVKALLNDLKASAEETASLPPDESPIRSVVFSGWTSYLDLIGYALDKHRIGYVRLDGSMSLRQRARVLETFKTDPDITVLLVSIKAGGQGLNLTAASKAYVMEPQFNPGVEQQAVDRIHRLGQTRPVHIVHYIMTGSVEEGILKLQKKKEDLAQMSLERKISKAEEAKRRLEELRDLFK